MYKAINALQSVIALEVSLNKSKSVYGYQLVKQFKARGVRYSHQQIYRELNRLPCLSHTVITQEGSPDIKSWALTDEMEPKIEDLKVSDLICYPSLPATASKLQQLKMALEEESSPYKRLHLKLDIEVLKDHMALKECA